MLKKVIIILIVLFISKGLFAQVKDGYLDVRGYDFNTNEPINLSGEWKLKYPGKNYVNSKVPGSWGQRYGNVTYTLTLLSSGYKNLIFAPSQINTKCKIYLNGQLIAESKQNKSLYIPIDLINGENVFTMRVENRTDLNSGIRSKPYIGSYDKLLDVHERGILKDTVVSGASFVIFIFFFALFLYYREDKSTLYFALICFFLFLRGWLTNDKTVYSYFPDAPYLLTNKLEYLSIYILPSLLLLFNKSYFKVSWNLASKVFYYVSLFFPLFVIFTAPKVYMSVLYWYYLFALLISLYLITSLTYYSIKKYEDALKILISILTLIAASFVDIYISFNNISENLILSRVMIVFTLFMSFIVSHKQIRNFIRIKKLTRDNRDVNRYLHKFIPSEFIQFIGKSDITSIELGDGIEKEMTVLFASLKDFYIQTRLLKGEEVVTLLNQYLSIVSPIIIKHGGFVDKFIDETIMALFPENSGRAIDAALEISNALHEYNKSNTFPLKVHSGIHHGSLFMGIVGDEKRFDATVISKSVNSASRISTFTKKIDKEILISETVFKNIESENSYTTNYMGRVKLKGNNESIGIYSVLTDYEKSQNKMLIESDNLFSITMKKLENSTLDKIEDVLWKIRSINPDHTPTLYYLKLIKENRRLEDLDK